MFSLSCRVAMAFDVRALLLVLLLASPAQAATDIACLGDSITYTAISRAPIPWPHIIEDALNAQYPGDYTVSNYGTPGHTAAQNLTTWTNSIRGKGYEILIVLTGVNGLLAGTAGATVWTSINQIVDEAKTDGMTVVLITILPFKSYIGWSAAIQTQTDTVLTSIRAEPGLTVLDLYPSWEQSAGDDILKVSYDIGDGLHPNQTGVEQLAVDVEGALGL